MKILHLEDNASDSILIERTLQRNGLDADVLCARSGDEFRKALDGGGFDVVLVDNGVPGFSGKAALQYSKVNNAAIPVIFCSGAAREDDVATRLKEGASDYVLKDHLWQLVAALRRVEAGRANDAVDRLTRQLDTVNQELATFSYAVAHDLRAPLRGISSQLEMLAQSLPGGRESTDADARIDGARAHVQQMSALIDGLLRLSRISQLELRVERFDLSELASEVGRRLHAQEPERQVDLRVQCDLEAEGDSALLGVVVENLICNAWKFSSLQPQATIEFGATVEKNGRRVYFVRDSGAGFDPHYADKLFQPFHRLHRQDEFPGTGVGLATVHRIIKRHAGDIWAESALGEGATFFFTLGAV